MDDHCTTSHRYSHPSRWSGIVLGIDDFSFGRGCKFSTILVDFDSHQVIDLLNECSLRSSATRMHTAPELEYVRRDCGNDHTQGANEGTPKHVGSPQIKELFGRCILACLLIREETYYNRRRHCFIRRLHSLHQREEDVAMIAQQQEVHPMASSQLLTAQQLYQHESPAGTA